MTKPFDQAAEEYFTPPEKPNPDFESWKHYANCAQNLKGETFTEEQLRKWADDPNKMLECVFCQIVEPPTYFHLSDFALSRHLDEMKRKGITLNQISITCCPRCQEYKGIQPHIPGWSDFE